ncbi:NUDIX domain-containing protein [Lutibacter sp. B2]|nr:NUDIX domain-containing protein [Lutibacter sp. B2]
MEKEYLSASTGIAVIKNKKVLLGDRKDGQGWCLAGGKQEPGETLEECAYRELEEEFGLRAKELKYVGKVFSEAVVKGTVKKVSPSIYICDEFEGEIKLQESEMLSYQWIDLKEALKIENIFLPSKEAIKKILKM